MEFSSLIAAACWELVLITAIRTIVSSITAFCICYALACCALVLGIRVTDTFVRVVIGFVLSSTTNSRVFIRQVIFTTI